MKIINYLLLKQQDCLGKFLFFSIFFSCVLSIGAQNQKIQFSKKQMAISAVFAEIEKQTGMSIAYSASLINPDEIVTIDNTDKNLSEALTYFLRNKNVTYKIEGQRILIIAAEKKQTNNRKITGIVIDEEGAPITGASVSIKGTTKGTLSDLNGMFSIEAKNGDLLDINFLGFIPQTIEIDSKTPANITITIKEDIQKLKEVVVTALGIKRDEKSLGYSATKIESEALTNATSHNWIDGLAGKVAGLSIQKGSAGPGGSARVTLRGESSFNMSNNEALFVVDGVPIYSGMTANSSTVYDGSDMPIDYGNAVADIDPSNIESVTVLKGAAATALYGARAGNGAIIITTKGGQKEKGIGVNISYDLTFEEVNRWPDFQYEYGCGSGENINNYAFGTNADLGITGTHTTWAYGPRYEGQMFYQFEGWNYDNPSQSVATPWIPRKNWYKGFFETGATHRENITIQGSNGKGFNMRFATTAIQNQWIVPNTGYDSQNFALSASYQVSKKLKLDSRITYYRRDSDNLPTIGYGQSSPTYSLLWSSNHIDINWMRNPWLVGQEGVQQDNRLNRNFDNPYFIVNEHINTLDRDRIYGNTSATYSFDQYLSLTIRGGMDYSSEFRTSRKPMSSTQFANGYYREQTINNTELNGDFLLKYDRQFGDIGVTGNFGGNTMQREYKQVSLLTKKLLVPGVYSLRNTDDPLVPSFTGPRKKTVNSLYGLIQLNYKRAIFLDVTGRNDWSSTLPKDNCSYFFPSVSTSMVLNDLINFGDLHRYISFAKLRASWAQVGIDTNPYYTGYYYSNSEWPGGGTQPTVIPPKSLKPEMVTSYEFGTDLRFMENKFGIDFAFYTSTSKDLIVQVPIPQSTGVQQYLYNAGKIRNKGFELATYYDVMKSKDFDWKVSATWSKNINEVLYLAEDLDTWVITTGPAGARIEGRPGGSLGDMYGNTFVKAPKGSFITNADGSKKDISGQVVYKDGYPQLTTDSQAFLGNTQPKWKAGLSNSFRYKDFTFNFTFEGQYGGKVYSLTHSILSYSGKLTNTLKGRYDGLVGEGVMQNEKGEWVKNNVVVDNIQTYYELMYQRENTEANLLKTSFIKLREARIAYKLPDSWLKKTKLFQHATVSVYGSNLFTITNYPGFDPEINTLAGAEIQAGFEIAQLPGTRSYGFGISFGL